MLELLYAYTESTFLVYKYFIMSVVYLENTKLHCLIRLSNLSQYLSYK